MKIKVLLVLFFFGLKTNAQVYHLKLNDSTFDINIGKNYEIILEGRKIKLLLTSPDTLNFDKGAFSFNYPKEFNPASQLIDSTVEQFTIITAGGSGIVLQHYFTLNPESLNEIMLREITKENVEYGYQLKREDYDRTLKSGQVIRVNKAVLTYKDNVYNYEVAAIGKKDEGILVITLQLGDTGIQGKKIIDMMWNSLQFR